MLLPLVIVAALTSTVVPTDRFYWQGRIPAGQSIEIDGVYGSIKAEPASGDKAEVVAYKPGSTTELARVIVELVQHADGVTVRAHYPEAMTEQSDQAKPNLRVDFTVRVPKGVRFIGRTVNGSVEAHALRSDAAAYTVNGNVRMSTAGEAQAHTVNGSITAYVGRTSSGKSLKFSTVNGAITLEMPSQVNASIHAKTLHGGISSEFCVPVTSHLAGGTAAGSLGKGGPDVKLNTVNGNIRLRRSVTMPL